MGASTEASAPPAEKVIGTRAPGTSVTSGTCSQPVVSDSTSPPVRFAAPLPLPTPLPPPPLPKLAQEGVPVAREDAVEPAAEPAA